MATLDRDVIIYHSSCGHIAPDGPGQESSESHVHTCQDQPSYHCILRTSYGPCENCQRGHLQPLTGDSLNERTVTMQSRKTEEDKFRLEVSERNEPWEEALCNLPARLLGIPQARQLHNLLYQLENIPMLTLYSPLIARRQDRLQMAICRMPFELVEELSLEEGLTHLEILQESYETAILNYEISSIESQDRFLEKAIELEQTIAPQIAFLHEIFGCTAEEHPELSARWIDVHHLFFSHQERFNFLVIEENGEDMDMDDEWDYYISGSEAEKERRLAAVSRLVRSGLVEDTTDVDSKCPICGDNYGVSHPDKEPEAPTRLACGHVHGPDCLFRWLLEHNSCPSCRRNFGGVL